MPRKLCWIEVDEEGKALTLDFPALWAAYARGFNEALRSLPDATEEIAEAVAKQIVQTADECNICVHRHEADVKARSLLTRLASAPTPKPEAKVND